MSYLLADLIRYIRVMDLSFTMKLLKELFLLSLIMFWRKTALIWKQYNGAQNQIALREEYSVNKK